MSEEMEFKIEWCSGCQCFYVRCPKCGNNSCNGGYGKMDMDGNPLPWNDRGTESQPCDICPLAYQHQYLYWELEKFCTCETHCTCEYLKEGSCYTGEIKRVDTCPIHGDEDKKPKSDTNCPVHKKEEDNE